MGSSRHWGPFLGSRFKGCGLLMGNQKKDPNLGNYPSGVSACFQGLGTLGVGNREGQISTVVALRFFGI